MLRNARYNQVNVVNQEFHMEQPLNALKEKTKDYLLRQAIDKAAEFLGDLAHKSSYADINKELNTIKAAVDNDSVFEKIQPHLVILFKNYNVEHWTKDQVSAVVSAVSNLLKQKSKTIQSNLSHAIELLSNKIAQTLSNKWRNGDLKRAIKSESVLEVKKALAAGADPATCLKSLINKQQRTHLLEYFLYAGLNPLTSKIEGFNIIQYAVFKGNLKAVEILTDTFVTINYPLLINDAINDEVTKSPCKSIGGNALTIAIMNKKEDIARHLLTHHATLSIVKKGAAGEFPNYNNLQLLIRNKQYNTLTCALSLENKDLSAKADLLQAINYYSGKQANDSKLNSMALAMKYISDKSATAIAAVKKTLTDEIEKHQGPIDKNNLSEEESELSDNGWSTFINFAFMTSGEANNNNNNNDEDDDSENSELPSVCVIQ